MTNPADQRALYGDSPAVVHRGMDGESRERLRRLKGRYGKAPSSA
jgi:hypothetical protein